MGSGREYYLYSHHPRELKEEKKGLNYTIMLKKTNKYQTLLAVCLLTLSACSTNETLTDSPIDQSKTPIELTAGIIGENAATTRGLTRTVTNDNPYGHAAAAFSSGTSLYMVIKSENETSTTSTQYTRTIGYAQETAPTPANSTTTGFASAYQRYWEDTQSPARDSKLSIYAACVPGYYLNGTQTVESPTGTADGTTWTIGTSNTYTNTWGTDLGATTIAWPLRGTAVGSQDATFLANQDLCFSNNVSFQDPNDTNTDYRLKFNGATNKFTSGRMVFHHALTQVVFKIIKGEGFGTGTGVFNFTNDNENIVLTGFNTAGKLDISTGDFSNIDNTTPITSLASSTGTGFDYVLTCLMLPGSALTSTATNEVYFTIDNNKYHIKKSELAAALSDKTLTNTSLNALDEGSTMRPGVKYIFTMTVSKKGIDKLSASVVPWEEVEAEQMPPSNARISVSVMTNGTKQTGATALFDLYRSANVNTSINDNWVSYEWGTGYTSNKAQLSENTTAGEYTAYGDAIDPSTAWYWPDNKTFYHFRTVMPVNHTVTENTTTGDYISLTGAENYTDVCWGAPFSALDENHPTTPLNGGSTLTYSLESGFDNTGTTTHQISKAIGPTTSAINMMMFHMMSDVTINLTTTTGSDAVNLNGVTISLSNIHPTGTVLMGNGLVTATGTPENVSPSLTYNSTNKTSKVENYGFVPQTLEDVTEGNDVVLTITTADKNQYIVDMKDVKFSASSISNTLIANPYSETSPGSGNYKIDRWYPNFKYTYTFQLKKTGIETISATINDWENISAEPQTVQIK